MDTKHAHTHTTDTPKQTKPKTMVTETIQSNLKKQPITKEAGKYIVNLSSKTLTVHATSLLDKGLGYAITNTKDHLYSPQIDPYIRRLRWKDYFRYHPATPKERHPLAPPSNRVSPKATTTNEKYERVLGLATERVHPNLSCREQQALHKLKKRKDIVINKADKGSCIVIEDTDTYIRNGREHLANSNIYEPLDINYTKTLVKRINEATSNSSLDTIT